MLLIEGRADPSAQADETLVLPFEARRRSRLRAGLAGGEEVGCFFDPGTVLRHGDKLLGQDGRVVEVVAAPEPLLEVRAANAREQARAAYHLGNRHVAVQVGEAFLRLAPDHVLKEMLIGLGCEVHEVVAPFEPEAGAYGHSHQDVSTAGLEAARRRIHETRRP